MDRLTFIATTGLVVGLFAAVGLALMALMRRRTIRRVQETRMRVLRGDGIATAVPGSRAERLKGRETPSQGDVAGGRGWALAAGALGVLLVVAVVGAGAWWLATGRSSGSGGGTTTTTAKPPKPKPLPQDQQVVVPTIPPALPSSKAAYTVAVFNASGVDGAGSARVAPRVEQAGYTLGVIDAASRDDVTRSVVMWPPGKQDVAQNVAHDLNIRIAPPLDGLSMSTIGGADAVVVVGRDLAKP